MINNLLEFSKGADFNKQAVLFVKKLIKEIAPILEVKTEYTIDHVCFRVESISHYEAYKVILSEFATLLIEAPVNGRNISTFKLHEPFWVDSWRVDLVELPAPKEGSHYKSGFEHIEIVVPENLKQLEIKLRGQDLHAKGISKPYNPELGLSLNSGVVKFHNQSLESVVRLEANVSVYKALLDSQVLETMKDLNPLVVGTFPLGVHREDSDLDIVVGSTSRSDFSDLAKTFTSYENFYLREKVVNETPTLILGFIKQGIKFEIFAQEKPSHKSRSYKHFLIEEKALRFMNKKSFQALMTLRSEGLKTEEAFCRVLNIPADGVTCFDKLLDLTAWSDKDWEGWTRSEESLGRS